MYIKVISSLFYLLTLISCQNYRHDESIALKIEELQKKYAPDKRVVIFNIKAEENKGELKLTGETNLPDAKNEFSEYLDSLNVDYVDEVKLLPGDELGDEIYGIITISVANIRSKPNHPAELATQALLGTPVKVLDYNDYFYRIQTPDGYISWIDDSGIQRVNKDMLNDWLQSPKIIYLREYGFSYSFPDLKSTRVSDLVMGNLLKLTGEQNDFFQVEYPDKRVAYVEKKYCKNYEEWLKLTKATQGNIVKTANLLMGVPYLWGGTSTKGVDCSGFTKTVFFMNGLVIPRDASQQVHAGELVDTKNEFDNLLPGDLLFFGRKASGETKERITHVAIYIGDYKYIHASGMVKINSLDSNDELYSEYRHKHFIRAKRLLNATDSEGISLVNSNKFYTGEF